MFVIAGMRFPVATVRCPKRLDAAQQRLSQGTCSLSAATVKYYLCDNVMMPCCTGLPAAVLRRYDGASKLRMSLAALTHRFPIAGCSTSLSRFNI
jgi:hypothetical protein